MVRALPGGWKSKSWAENSESDRERSAPSGCGPRREIYSLYRGKMELRQYRNYKVVCRRYASLFFSICIDVDDSELSIMEVRVRDRLSSSICLWRCSISISEMCASWTWSSTSTRWAGISLGVPYSGRDDHWRRDHWDLQNHNKLGSPACRVLWVILIKMQSKLESLLLPEQSPLFPEPGNVKDRYKVGPIIGKLPSLSLQPFNPNHSLRPLVTCFSLILPPFSSLHPPLEPSIFWLLLSRSSRSLCPGLSSFKKNRDLRGGLNWGSWVL